MNVVDWAIKLQLKTTLHSSLCGIWYGSTWFAEACVYVRHILVNAVLMHVIPDHLLYLHYPLHMNAGFVSFNPCPAELGYTLPL